MPELPEVEASRKLLSCVVGQRVVRSSAAVDEARAALRARLLHRFSAPAAVRCCADARRRRAAAPPATPRPQKVFVDVSASAFDAALTGATLLAVHRRGKHLWWELDRRCGTLSRCRRAAHHAPNTSPTPYHTRTHRPLPMFHFGMTGSFAVRGLGATKYKSFTVDESSWPPRFTKLQLEFSNGTEVAFVDARRFARVRLAADPSTHLPSGYDPNPEPSQQ